MKTTLLIFIGIVMLSIGIVAAFITTEKETINLPKGEKLTSVTIGPGLIYLTEPMEKDYVPKKKTLCHEDLFGTKIYYFIEQR